MLDKHFKFEGTRLLWGAIFVNCVFAGMAHWFHNIVLNVMEDVILDYLGEGIIFKLCDTFNQDDREAFLKTHGISLSTTALYYVYSFAVVSIWSLGAVVGSAIAHTVAEAISRRNSLMVFLNILNLSAAVMVLIAQATYIPEFLFVGRFMFGMGNGFFDVVLGLFMTEIAPTSIRGLAPSLSLIPGILNGMFIMVLGLPNFLGKPHLWAYVIAIGALPSVVPLCCFWKFPKRDHP